MGQVLPLFPSLAADRIDTRGYESVPPHTVELLERYVFQHRSPGAFLTAVLCNDLHLAVTYADEDNLRAIKQISFLIFNRIPNEIWGSETAVELHLRQGV